MGPSAADRKDRDGRRTRVLQEGGIKTAEFGVIRVCAGLRLLSSDSYRTQTDSQTTAEHTGRLENALSTAPTPTCGRFFVQTKLGDGDKNTLEIQCFPGELEFEPAIFQFSTIQGARH